MAFQRLRRDCRPRRCGTSWSFEIAGGATHLTISDPFITVTKGGRCVQSGESAGRLSQHLKFERGQRCN